MTEALLTAADVAKRLRLTEPQVYELRRRHQWPCVSFSRKTIRFTEAQVEEIVARHLLQREQEQPAAAQIVVPGQTAGSRKRRAS